jgi:hypothetical protein
VLLTLCIADFLRNSFLIADHGATVCCIKQEASCFAPTAGSNKRLSSTTTPTGSLLRLPSAASVANAAAAKRQAESVQINLPFAQRDPYPIGLKILLPDTIYPNAASVLFELLLVF